VPVPPPAPAPAPVLAAPAPPAPAALADAVDWLEWDNTAPIAALLGRGADVNGQSNYMFETALYIAINMRYWRVALLLLAHGANVNAKTKCGETPLHLVSAAGSQEFFVTLLDAGADVTATTNNGLTAMHLAAKGGHVLFVQVLVDKIWSLVRPLWAAAARRDRGSPTHRLTGDALWLITRQLLNPRDKKGWTPLHYAAAEGHASTVARLLELGADAQ